MTGMLGGISAIGAHGVDDLFPIRHLIAAALCCANKTRSFGTGHVESELTSNYVWHMTEIILVPIGSVSSPRMEALDDDWDSITSTITVDVGQFGEEALKGLKDFSHIEIIYFFDQVDADKVQTGARHPRGNTEWPEIGIFAQRGKARPNRLGVTVCRLLGVDGLTLTVNGLDAIDGSPVLDIKPYMFEFAPRGDVRQPDWTHELMASYWGAT